MDLPQRIQDHYEDPYHRGRCESVTHFAEQESACAESSKDVIVIELQVADAEVREIWFDGEGCDLSQAFASMLAENLENQRTDDVLNLSLEQAFEQLNVSVAADRAGCCKLALEAIQAAINSLGIESEDIPNFGGPDLGDEC